MVVMVVVVVAVCVNVCVWGGGGSSDAYHSVDPHVRADRCNSRPLTHIPNAHGGVVRRSDEHVPIRGRERDSIDVVEMPCVGGGHVCVCVCVCVCVTVRV
jgi:hypothetical protein